MNKKYLIITVAAALSMAACKPHLTADAPGNGGLDFSRYVAVGNSLTAGYADGTLYRSGQQNSYPAILAKQFRAVGGGDFKIPLLPGEAGYPTLKRVLGSSTDCMGVTSLGPILYPGAVDTAGSAVSIAAQGPFNNLGVPGIRAIDFLVPSYPAFNPYSRRFFSNRIGTPLEEISRKAPTVFTAWIGNNDVLGYALAGGVGKVNGSFFDQDAISDPSLFAIGVDSVVKRLTANGAKGALMNIPDVTAIPYFTTIPYNGLVLTQQSQVDQINNAYKLTGLTFSLGNNPFIIQDTSVAVLKFRPIRSDEYVLLTVPQDSLKCAGWGSYKPIPAKYILDAKEVNNVRNATATYNSIIQQEAAAYGLAFVDMNTYMKTLSSGIMYNGVTFNAVFVKGGAFSLDGVHLTPRGYALAANEIIRTINAFYGSSVPMADINAYGGLQFP